MVAFPIVMTGAISVLFLRLWYFQVVEAPVLIERAESTRVVPVTKPAPRGLVFDRNGIPIATVRPEIVVTAIPNEVRKNPWVLDRVAALLGASVDKMERKLRDAAWRPYLPTPIYVGASIKAGAQIAESGDELPGIGVETEPLRHYPDPMSFTHVMGYVWTPSDGDVKRIEKLDRPVPDYVGKTGVERAFDPELMGIPGAEKVAIDARRRPIRVEGRDAATPGDQLVLTLDADLQRFATRLLKEQRYTRFFDGGKYIGGAVAIDPRTGEVLAMVSAPTFDQGLFNGGISDAEWRSINDDPTHPMFNRAISGAFAPGSTFKIVTAVAAEMSHKFNKNMTFNCPGGYFRKGLHLKCLGHHGEISFESALEKSCNTYFCNLGALVGEDGLRKASLAMGLGQRTGIEIGGPTESRGVIPTVDWLRKVSGKKNPPWYLGDTANFSIGQGYVATTPIQMANVAAMVANNGVSYRPHLLKAVKDPRGVGKARLVEPEVLHKIDLSPEFWAELRRSLVRVVDHGTAKGAQIANVEWGGKTGSAEHGRGKKTHSWFVGYAPADNPKIAICVVAEGAGHGSDVAAPIAGDIVRHYLTAPKKPAASASASAAPAASPAARSNVARR